MPRSYLKVWMSDFFEGLVPYNGGNILRVPLESRPLVPRSRSESLSIQSTITLERP